MHKHTIAKFIICSLLSMMLFTPGNAQRQTVEQLTERLKLQTKTDTVRINLLNTLSKRSEISPALRDSLVDEAMRLSQKINYRDGEAMALLTRARYADRSLGISLSKQALGLAEKTGNKKTLFWAYRTLGDIMLYTSDNINAIDIHRKALEIAMITKDPELIISAQLAFVDYYKGVVINYPLALEQSLKALYTAEQYHDTEDLPNVYRNIGLVYLLLRDNEKALVNLQKALDASNKTGDMETAQYTLNDMGEQYRTTGKYKEALSAYGKAFQLIKDPFNIELNQSNVADVYQRMGNDSLAFVYGFRSLTGAKQLKDTIGLAWIDNILSRAYLHAGKTDSALYYGNLGYQYATKTQVLEFARDNSEALANAYTARHDFDKALYFYKIFISARDSMLNNEITNKAHLTQFNYDLQKKQAEITVLNKDRQLQDERAQRQRLLLAGTIALLVIIVTSLVILFINNNKRKKAYALLHEQKQEIQLQRDQINQALNDLRLTQNQLIQAEKMASLGELTAGIAHEIQNPLNFVNNFSEVNAELIDELEQEADKGNMAEVKAIAKDIKDNEQKINHHGKRADAIVKGMLQHSRQTKGVKEPTDINALCDEYLRLAYHGLRAKEKDFNADFSTDFDEAVGEINIVPQDIGRVLLNLYNNAFYSVNEKQKASKAELAGASRKYEPTISVTTKKINNKVEISVKDNGNGIPQNVINKIFQPFFTTKPTGQGTGLGLSLSYDIIKAHGGEIRVETNEGEGTKFVIQLAAI